ncbi:putative baseplate assembly protein [Streptomyces sp. NPDC048420]|uniref:putative baseplate assembly protein n=1 Tax=Streptomyces sp. NPDC048420 TaxID=3155755 RepID=UPI00343E970D
MTDLDCCRDDRREAIRRDGVSNGIDYLEVHDGPGVPAADRQRLLDVHFLRAPAPALVSALTSDCVAVTGGVRIPQVPVESVAWANEVLTVRVGRPGDHSVYTLRLRTRSGAPLPDLDERLSEIGFSFKADCPSDFDCDHRCPSHGPEALPLQPPDIDYLTRDYAGFRRLMLDRLAVLAPELRERHAADLAVVLVEALAYSADHQSYRLDAIGMESTLATARSRISARRHARLVAHRPHDGSNARTWVRILTTPGAPDTTVPAGTQLLTRLPWLGPVVEPGSAAYHQALSEGPVVFETMHDAVVAVGRAELPLYTWGDDECCLPAGATSATVLGRPPLDPDDVVVLGERVDARTGTPAGADPAHRHAVRLTAATPGTDPLGGMDVTELTWADEDALPFDLCLSARTADRVIRDIGVVWGNIVLADHGRTRTAQRIATVPDPDSRLALPGADRRCSPGRAGLRPARFTLPVPEPDVTMVSTLGRVLPGGRPGDMARFDPGAPAASAPAWERRHVLPAVRLKDGAGHAWRPVPDLLGSDAFARDFVVEVESDGTAVCRFGTEGHGMRPHAGTVFDLIWRQGNGRAGNIGGDTLAHIVTALPGITGATNPLPGHGGTDADNLARIRQDAPAAFLVPERAVTAEDYARMAARHPEVQRAVAVARYTGSWYTVFLAVDRSGGRPVDARFAAGLREFLEKYRMAGDDLRIDGPYFAALDVVLRVCVGPDYHRSDVAAALLERLGPGRLADGRRAFFHPDNLTFGAPVVLSALLAAAHEVAGVVFVEPVTFRRRATARRATVPVAELPMGHLEIARLDNDPDFPDRGTLTLELEGGR